MIGVAGREALKNRFRQLKKAKVPQTLFLDQITYSSARIWRRLVDNSSKLNPNLDTLETPLRGSFHHNWSHYRYNRTGSLSPNLLSDC